MDDQYVFDSLKHLQVHRSMSGLNLGPSMNLAIPLSCTVSGLKTGSSSAIIDKWPSSYNGRALHHFDDYTNSPKGGWSHHLSALQSCRVHQPILPERRLISRRMGGSPAPDQPTRDQIPIKWPNPIWDHILMTLLLPMVSGNPHTLWRQTWVITSKNGDQIQEASAEAPQGTWWPNLTVELCDLTAGSWGVFDWDMGMDHPEFEGQEWCNPKHFNSLEIGKMEALGGNWIGCSHPSLWWYLRDIPIYICPGGRWDMSGANRCGGLADFFCKEWGCEKSGNT